MLNNIEAFSLSNDLRGKMLISTSLNLTFPHLFHEDNALLFSCLLI